MAALVPTSDSLPKTGEQGPNLAEDRRRKKRKLSSAARRIGRAKTFRRTWCH